MSRKQCVDNSYLSVSYYSRLANSPCSGYVQPGSDVCGFVDWFVLGVCGLVCFGCLWIGLFGGVVDWFVLGLSLIHISEPTRQS